MHLLALRAMHGLHCAHIRRLPNRSPLRRILGEWKGPGRSAMPSSRRTWYCPPARKLLAGLALFAYLAATSGFAFSVLPRKDRGQPFPCQDHACGCQSAEECWRHCCCFSPEERLAWAEQHAIEPPVYAEKPVSEGWRTTPRRERAANPDTEEPCCGNCCQAKIAPAAQPSCCHEKPCHVPAAPSTPKRGPVLSVLHCQGLTTLWVTLGTVPLVPAVAWSPQLPTVERFDQPDSSALTRSLSPPEPPPRGSLA
jgi:hypothetical protein